MKKVLIIFLALILALSFAACSKNGNTDNTAKGDQTDAAENKDSSDGGTIDIGGYKIKLTKEANHGDLYFKENTAEMELAGYEQSFNMYCNKEEGQIFVIRLVYFKGASIDEVMSGSDATLTDKTVNGIQYKYFEYEENGTPAHNYVYNYNGTTYTIIFVSNYDMTSLENTFLGSVYFKASEQ